MGSSGRELKILKISDNLTFRTHLEVMSLFGSTLRGHQRAGWNVPDNSMRSLWFPHLYERGNWHNKLVKDDFGNPKAIVEIAMTEEGKSSVSDQAEQWKTHKDWIFPTFGKTKNRQEYRYVGSFKILDPSKYKEKYGDEYKGKHIIVYEFFRDHEVILG